MGISSYPVPLSHFITRLEHIFVTPKSIRAKPHTTRQLQARQRQPATSTMKRSASSSPVSDEPTAPTKAETSSPKSEPKSSPNKLSGWTPEKKRAPMEKFFDVGMASLKAAEVAEEVGGLQHDSIRGTFLTRTYTDRNHGRTISKRYGKGQNESARTGH